MLQQGSRRSSAQNHGLGGDVRLKSGEPAAVPTAVGVQKTETWLGPPHYQKYCYKRDINLSRRKVCSVYHVLHKCTRGERAVYLHRAGPGAMGHRRCLKSYDRGPNGIVRNNEERSWAPRRFRWYRGIFPTSPPRPIALSHRITYVSCRTAMAPWLLR